MGRLVVSPPKQSVYEISMKWNEQLGILTISGFNSGNQIVIINDIEHAVEFNEKGFAELEFSKSTPMIFYTIRIKDPGEKTGQKIGIFY